MVERFVFLANEKSTPKTRNLHPKNEESTPKKLTQKREIHTQNEKSTPKAKKVRGQNKPCIKKTCARSKKYIK